MKSLDILAAALSLAIFLLVAVMTLSGSLGSFFLKKASGEKRLGTILRSPSLYLGIGLYLIGCVLNIVLLRVVDYSVALPITALTYVWTLFISHWKLSESLTARKLFGVALIILGVALTAL